MKKFLKKNYITLIIAIVIIVIGYIYLFGPFKSNQIDLKKYNDSLTLFCQKEENINSEICRDFSLNGPFKGDVDVLYIFYNLLTDSLLSYLPLFIAFIISFLSLKEFSKFFNSSMAKLILIREKYSLFLKKFF